MSDSVTLADGDLVVGVGRRGGALLSVCYRGLPVLVPAGGPAADMACFPMVPFGNRLEVNRFQLGARQWQLQPNTSDPLYLHGDGWLGLWDFEFSQAGAATLCFARTADAASPYAYRARQHISLAGNRLSIGLSVQNCGPDTLPFGLGLHPFFARTPRTTLLFAAQRCWTERPGHLPGEPLPIAAPLDFSVARRLPSMWINNAFDGWQGTAAIHWPEWQLSATLAADPPSGCLMLFQPTDRSDIICLEPMTHLPNGHHRPDLGRLTLLAPSESLSTRLDIDFATAR